MYVFRKIDRKSHVVQKNESSLAKNRYFTENAVFSLLQREQFLSAEKLYSGESISLGKLYQFPPAENPRCVGLHTLGSGTVFMGVDLCPN